MRRRLAAAVIVAAIGSLLVGVRTGWADTSTITATEDTYVSQGNPSGLHGSYSYLATNAAPGERRAYVKFTVAGIPTGATGVSAALQLWGQSTSASTFTVWRTTSTWTEGSLTWNNQPPLGSLVTTRTGVSSGQYNSFDVSSYLTANGTYGMVVTTNSTTEIMFTSRDSTSNHPPKLLLTWTAPTTTTITTTPPPRDPVAAAAGDIACAPGVTRTAYRCHDSDTANLLLAGGYDAVLPVGDLQYECGELSAFQTVYDSSWGQVKSISRPAAGDNDYTSATCTTPGASGYFTYFGGLANPSQPACTSACSGYYSYDLGSWHVVVLNTECSQTGVGGCGATSPQGKWLAADLAAHPAQCTLAYWHRPRWLDTGSLSGASSYFVQALYNAGAEVILNGHSHIYERWAPQTPSGAVDHAGGIREFIVGTGGRNLHPLSSTPPANVEVRSNTAFGVLQLTLHPTSYDWKFIPEAGKTFTDSGSQTCH
jgi:acid phosphatase type 7